MIAQPYHIDGGRGSTPTPSGCRKQGAGWGEWGSDGRQGESRFDGNSLARPLRFSGGIHDFNDVQGVFR